MHTAQCRTAVITVPLERNFRGNARNYLSLISLFIPIHISTSFSFMIIVC